MVLSYRIRDWVVELRSYIKGRYGSRGFVEEKCFSIKRRGMGVEMVKDYYINV